MLQRQGHLAVHVNLHPLCSPGLLLLTGWYQQQWGFVTQTCLQITQTSCYHHEVTGDTVCVTVTDLLGPHIYHYSLSFMKIFSNWMVRKKSCGLPCDTPEDFSTLESFFLVCVLMFGLKCCNICWTLQRNYLPSAGVFPGVGGNLVISFQNILMSIFNRILYCFNYCLLPLSFSSSHVPWFTALKDEGDYDTRRPGRNAEPQNNLFLLVI